MNHRDNERNAYVRGIVRCDQQQANEIIDWMDRRNRNPEWATIEWDGLRDHIVGVVREMSQKRQIDQRAVAEQPVIEKPEAGQIHKTELRPLFSDANANPFDRSYIYDPASKPVDREPDINDDMPGEWTVLGMPEPFAMGIDNKCDPHADNVTPWDI